MGARKQAYRAAKDEQREAQARVVNDSGATLTDKQREANRLLGSQARHIMLFGGSRSGKTFALVRAIVVRALKAEDSRHLIARFRFNHVKQYVAQDTLPAVMKACFPGIPYKLDRQDWFVRLPNESEIWFGGLDEKERTEKILGAEYATVFLNEVSQISWEARNKVVTRIAQDRGLALKAYYDCNPPPQSHWSYKLFVKKTDPLTGQMIPSPDNYAAMLMNPQDNAAHIHADYLSELEELPERLRRRFLMGEWLPANEHALWDPDWFDQYRVGGGGDGPTSVPDMQRIVIAVDPSGADEDEEKHNDEIGIVAAGLGVDGHCYVFEDASKKTGPKEWGQIAANIYHARGADLVVGETNYGGAMVRFVVQTADPTIPFKDVQASRGKHVRAEPIAALYEQGKVHHVGRFPEMEDELAGFTTAGYIGAKSPNRADALIWAIAELFSGVVRKPRRPIQIEGSGDYDVHAF